MAQQDSGSARLGGPGIRAFSPRPASDGSPVLSVIIPMYQESGRIGATLRDVLETLDSWVLPTEVLAIDDGSTDGCGSLVERISEELGSAGSASARGVRVITLDANRGKGAAVRAGLAASRGHWVLMMDADNSARLTELSKLATSANRSRAGLVVGSRVVRGAEVRADPRRKLSGLVFRTILGSLGLGFVRDSQCGFKLYRRDMADLCVAKSRESGFAFDIEHIGLAEKSGIGTSEVGIRWVHMDGGTISVVRDGARMIGQAWRIRRRLRSIQPCDAAPPVASVLELKPVPRSTSGERRHAEDRATRPPAESHR